MAQLHALNESECRALLADRQVGRVAVMTPDGPHIVPVNYALVDDSVVVRTSPFTVLATYAPSSTLAFEIDDLDNSTRTGWSVLVRGKAEVVFRQPRAGAHPPGLAARAVGGRIEERPRTDLDPRPHRAQRRRTPGRHVLTLSNGARRSPEPGPVGPPTRTVRHCQAGPPRCERETRPRRNHDQHA